MTPDFQKAKAPGKEMTPVKTPKPGAAPVKKTAGQAGPVKKPTVPAKVPKAGGGSQVQDAGKKKAMLLAQQHPLTGTSGMGAVHGYSSFRGKHPHEHGMSNCR